MKENKFIIYNSGMAQRKALPKTALPRIYLIDREIASGKYPNAVSLGKLCKKHVQTIYRDIEFMQFRLRAPIEYDMYKKGYYYKSNTFRLSSPFTTAEDLLAVELVKELLDLYRDTPVYDQVFNLLESISIPLKGVANSKWYKDRIIVPKTITVPVDPDVWECLLSGLRENRVLTFDYLKGNRKPFSKEENKQDTKLSHRTVQPYQLMFDRSAWYLLAYDEDKKDKRIFYVSRIRNINLTEKTFTLAKDFDYRSFDGSSYFGIFAGKSVYKFEIEIYGDTHWTTEIKLADDQSIKETNTGAVISFTSNQLDKVFDWVLVQGANARPLKPKILADKWKETIKEMNKLADM